MNGDTAIINGDSLQDPFYASIIPQTMVLSGCTVLAFTIFIMVLVTPRPNHHGQAKSAASRAGIMRGATAPGNAIAAGGRPWLQKLAAGFVVVSLLIAISRASDVLDDQYENGFSNAAAVRNAIVDGTAIKIVRIISDTFTWLALIQTVIRVLPRHREKIITKWCGFCLVILDVVFSILTGFLPSVEKAMLLGNRSTISTLSYLFQFVLSLLYFFAIAYYSLRKRRFAFYHPQSKNIIIIAALSMTAILVPIIFFIIDLLGDKLAIWGDYVRWVSAAAASIVVWEWAERIELLEREERNDGVLGRQLRAEDDSLDNSPAYDLDWFKGYQRDHGPGGRWAPAYDGARDRSLQQVPQNRRDSQPQPSLSPARIRPAILRTTQAGPSRTILGPEAQLTRDQLINNQTSPTPTNEPLPFSLSGPSVRETDAIIPLGTNERPGIMSDDSPAQMNFGDSPVGFSPPMRFSDHMSASNESEDPPSTSTGVTFDLDPEHPPATKQSRSLWRPRIGKASKTTLPPEAPAGGRREKPSRVDSPKAVVVVPAPLDGEVYKPEDLLRLSRGRDPP